MAYALKVVLWLGIGKLVLAPREVGAAFDAIGLVGFMEVGLGLVCLLALWIGCNYLWCLLLQKLADRQRLRTRGHLLQETVEGRWRRRGRWLRARIQGVGQLLRIQ